MPASSLLVAPPLRNLVDWPRRDQPASCGRIRTALPSSVPARPIARARHTSECMPRHRVAGFRSVVQTAGQPGRLLDPRGSRQSDPRNPTHDQSQSPVFIQAAKACHFSTAQASSPAPYCAARIAIAAAVDRAIARRAKRLRLRLLGHRRRLPNRTRAATPAASSRMPARTRRQGRPPREATNLSFATCGASVTFDRRSTTTIGGKYRVTSKAGRAAPGPANFESGSVPRLGERRAMPASQGAQRGQSEVDAALLTGKAGSQADAVAATDGRRRRGSRDCRIGPAPRGAGPSSEPVTWNST